LFTAGRHDRRADRAGHADHRRADAQTIEDLWIEYRDELTAMNLGPFGRVTALIWDARFSLVTALLAGFGRAAAEVGAIIIVGGNIEGFHPHDDDGDCAGNLQGRPAARGRPRPRADRDRDRRQRAGLDRPPRRRTTGGMTMRAPSSELPIVFDGVTVTAGASRSSIVSRSRWRRARRRC
jgi:hypothetical protein